MEIGNASILSLFDRSAGRFRHEHGSPSRLPARSIRCASSARHSGRTRATAIVNGSAACIARTAAISARVAPLPPMIVRPRVITKPRLSGTFSATTLPTTTARPPTRRVRSIGRKVGAPTVSSEIDVADLLVEGPRAIDDAFLGTPSAPKRLDMPSTA